MPAGRTLGAVWVRCAVLLLTLAACGSSSAASHLLPASAGPGCGPAGVRTLAASRLARVYATSAEVYGCSERTRRTTRLGQSGTCVGSPKVTAVTVAGESAAYGTEICGVDTGSSSLVVRRLSDGRVLRQFPAISGPIRPESFVSVASVVAKPGGAVAWIALAESILTHSSSIEVLAAGSSGTGSRVLDRGRGINPGSLALRGSRLTWSDHGRTRSASLR